MHILKPLLGLQINLAHPLSRGLVGCWLFNEGSGRKVFDSSGNENTGTFQGTAPSWSAAGKFGSAVLFPGTDEYIDVGDIVDAEGTNTLTAGAWIKAASVPDWVGILGKYDTGGTDHSYMLCYDNTSKMRFRIYTIGWHTVTSTSTILAGTWVYLVGVYNGTDLIIYVNGIREASTPTLGNIQAAAIPLTLGRAQDVVGQYFDGQIDHVMIYNRALHAAEVAQLYREPFCMFPENIMPEFAISA